MREKEREREKKTHKQVCFLSLIKPDGMTGPCLTGLDMDTRLYSRYISLLLEERKQLQDGQSRCLYKYNHHGTRVQTERRRRPLPFSGLVFFGFSTVSRLYEDLREKNREEG